LAEAGNSDVLVLAVPSSSLRALLASLPFSPAGAILVSAIKGFEVESGKRVSQVVSERFPSVPFAVLSGPTFAEGVMRGDPTAAVVASGSPETSRLIQLSLSSPTFRLYQSDDVTGVELFAGLKNVIAIAAGIVSGLGYGHNTLAALLTRGLAEISRLMLARGGREKTLLGLAGVGDLVLTCTGAQSRNRRLGEEIGRGRHPAAAMAGLDEVAEGTLACLAAARLAAESSVEMPIAEAVRRVLYDNLAPGEAIHALMTRHLRAE
jgi:glycerol-3-phosphate dehydrogenase (NAD(P)+)